MKKTIRASIVCLSLVFVSALSFSPNAMGAPYKRVLKKWTRSDSVFNRSDFHADILWSATLLGDSMIAAQAEKYRQIYQASPGQKEDFFASIENKRGDGVLFFLSFYSHDWRFDDLTNPLAKWEVRLTAGDRVFQSSRIEKSVRLSPLDSVLYPHIGPWSKGYYVWFPVEAEREPFPWTLSVYGPKAHSKLFWK